MALHAQAFAAAHGSIGAHAPALAVHPCPALALEVLERLGDGADHLLASGEHRPAPLAHRHADHQEHERRAGRRYAADQGVRNVEAARHAIGVDQDDRAEHERDQPAYAERAERRQERFGHHEGDAEQHERQAGVVHRQQMERIKREQHADRAHHAGQDQAGVGELEDQGVDPEQDQDVGHARVGDHGEDLGSPIDLDLDDRGVSGFQPRFLVYLLQKRWNIGRDEVDDLELHRLLRRQAHRLAHRLLSPVGVAAAQLGEAPYVSHGIVGDLLGHGVEPGALLVVLVPGSTTAADGHRRSRAKVRPRRHRRVVAGIQDEGPGAGSARAARRDIGGDRNRRGEDVLDHLAHRGVEPAGRVHLQNDELRLVFGRARKGTPDEIGAGGPNRSFDRDNQNALGPS